MSIPSHILPQLEPPMQAPSQVSFSTIPDAFLKGAGRNLPATAFKVYAYARSYCHGGGNLMWASPKTLADDSGLSERAVQGALATLEEAGAIQRYPRYLRNLNDHDDWSIDKTDEYRHQTSNLVIFVDAPVDNRVGVTGYSPGGVNAPAPEQYPVTNKLFKLNNNTKPNGQPVGCSVATDCDKDKYTAPRYLCPGNDTAERRHASWEEVEAILDILSPLMGKSCRDEVGDVDRARVGKLIDAYSLGDVRHAAKTAERLRSGIKAEPLAYMEGMLRKRKLGVA